MARSTHSPDGTIPSDLPTYTVGQVAEIIGCTKITVRRMADEGRIAAFRLRGRGSERRVTRGALIDYLIRKKAGSILADFFGLPMPAPQRGPTDDERRRREESLARVSRRAKPPQDDV